jgi:MFS family permease
MAAFLAVESRIENPIMPLRILRLRGLVSGSVVRGFMVTGMYSTFFLGTLYLEHVRHYSAVQTGAAFLPWTLTVAALSLGITTRLVNRFGELRVLLLGMVSVGLGLLVMATVGAQTSFFPTFFVACVAIGLGLGTAFMPLLSIAMSDVPSQDAGLGSGLTNVSQQVSGALGVAVLGTVASNHTKALLADHDGIVSSLLGGYHLAFVLGAISVAAGIAVALAVLRPAGSKTQLQLASAPGASPAPEPSPEGAPTIDFQPERQAA